MYPAEPEIHVIPLAKLSDRVPHPPVFERSLEALLLTWHTLSANSLRMQRSRGLADWAILPSKSFVGEILRRFKGAQQRDGHPSLS